MARNILFLIHGVGKQPPNWAEAPGGVLDTLKAAAKRYSFFRDKKLEDSVEVVPIGYDDQQARERLKRLYPS
jgi:hypothetical protein